MQWSTWVSSQKVMAPKRMTLGQLEPVSSSEIGSVRHDSCPGCWEDRIRWTVDSDGPHMSHVGVFHASVPQARRESVPPRGLLGDPVHSHAPFRASSWATRSRPSPPAPWSNDQRHQPDTLENQVKAVGLLPGKYKRHRRTSPQNRRPGMSLK